MPPRVEVGELVHAVQHVSHQLLQEQARGNARPPAEAPSYCVRQVLEVGIVHDRHDALGRGRLLDEKGPDAGTNPREHAEVEAGQPDLDRTRIVVSCVCRKIRVQPRRCPADVAPGR
jgi:hypothetical protein